MLKTSYIMTMLFAVTLIGCNADQIDNINNTSAPTTGQAVQTIEPIQTEQTEQTEQTGQTAQDLLAEPIAGNSKAELEAGIFQLPATIEAEDYTAQSGIRLGQTDDTSGSDFVGWIEDKDYTKYTINVPSAGTYTLDARVASKSKTAQLEASVNGNVVGSVTVTPTGGWNTWKTVRTTVQLSAGEQTLWLVYRGTGESLMNINWFSLKPTNDEPVQQIRISSLAEFIDLQDASDQNIKMEPGTYHISSSSKSLFSGGDWPATVQQEWPGLFQFTGSNNTFDLTDVKFTFDSTILSEMPSIAHGSLVELGGIGNQWIGFSLEEIPNSLGDYGAYRHVAGGIILVISGKDHDFNTLTLKTRFSRPYGFGSLYGKTGSSAGTLPNMRLSKKSGLFIHDLENTRLTNIMVDHSSFGHALFLSGPIDGVIFDTVTVVAETRSTNSLIADGIDGIDRNGVPFGLTYNGIDLIGRSANNDFLELFDTSNLNRCQNLGGGTQQGPIEADYQYSLIEGAFRGYQQEEIYNVEIYNAQVVGARSGIALEFAANGLIVDNMKVTGVAGHGVPACGGWNGTNGGEGDATAYGPPSNSILKNAQADAAYSTIMEVNGDSTDITADIELLDPENGYNRPASSTALALLSGDNHKIRIWKSDNKALDRDLIIKVGTEETTNLLLCNMTQQAVSISSNVGNSIIYSVGQVQDSSSSAANNQIMQLSSSDDEPQICASLESGDPSIPPEHFTGEELHWGDQVVLAGTSNNGYTGCGWYGCRVGYVADDLSLDFTHGGDNPTGFYLNPDNNLASSQSCVQWNDKVVIALTSEDHNTSNCGWYGCRVAKLNDANGISFGHGTSNPTSFHIRPPANESKSGCVTHTDEVVLAASPEGYNTSDCGWYGCEVLQFDGNDIVVEAGSSNPQGIHLRSWEQTLGN